MTIDDKQNNEATTNHSVPHYTILVIDDNPINLGVVVDYLEGAGFEIIVARDGELGLRRARLVQPELILLDVMMPGIDGFETCRRLKDTQETRDIPVIFMTALTNIESKVQGFKAGGVDYITKPFQVEELLARVNTHLALHRLRYSYAAKNLQLEMQMTERKRAEESLRQAHEEITLLNNRLKTENLRLEAEVDVARKIQKLLLPTMEELQAIEMLDIAGFMEAADEVGGDYYDVLQHNGMVKIGIGDVTGHGLESGLVTLMTQMAVRTLMISNIQNPTQFLGFLNEALFGNLNRMGTRKNLSLTLLDYQDGQLKLSGQHEQVIVVRKNGETELIDTTDLGFPLGMLPQITEFVKHTIIYLAVGDGVVLYTDGITDAVNQAEEYYGLSRLRELVSRNWEKSAIEIREAVVADVWQYVGQRKVYDDVTFLVIKRV